MPTAAQHEHENHEEEPQEDVTLAKNFAMEKDANRRKKSHLTLVNELKQMLKYDEEKKFRNVVVVLAALIVQALTSLSSQEYLASYIVFFLVFAVFIYPIKKIESRSNRHLIIGACFCALCVGRMVMDSWMQFVMTFWYVLVPSALVVLQMPYLWALAINFFIVLIFLVRILAFPESGQLGPPFYATIPYSIGVFGISIYSCYRSEQSVKLSAYVSVGLRARLKKVSALLSVMLPPTSLNNPKILGEQQSNQSQIENENKNVTQNFNFTSPTTNLINNMPMQLKQYERRGVASILFIDVH